MTRDEATAHALAINAAETEESFVTAFVAFMQDVVDRETDPYEKIALFVFGIVQTKREIVEVAIQQALAQRRGGGSSS